MSTNVPLNETKFTKQVQPQKRKSFETIGAKTWNLPPKLIPKLNQTRNAAKVKKPRTNPQTKLRSNGQTATPTGKICPKKNTVVQIFQTVTSISKMNKNAGEMFNF
jgi:hypothetical protein